MRLTVRASKTYDIVSYPDFDGLLYEIEKIFRGEKILIVSDSNVFPLYGDAVLSALKDKKTETYVIPAGERSKQADNYLGVIEKLAVSNFGRKDAVLALGGGVVGDLAGFAAATYMRGIGFIQCPTSFLAMIDSSVGGKTAIDLPQGKNLLGAFYQPDLVYIPTAVLTTLPQREVRCGMGEAVKYAFLSTKITADLLKKGITEELIFSCVDIKRNIVEKDEYDHGKRACLNLGHTVGHAIESLSDYTLSHGECVAKGIAQIIKMSKKYYGLTDEKEKEMNTLLALCGCNLDPLFPLGIILDKTIFDKKKEKNGVSYVLLQDIGRPQSVVLTEKQAKELLL